MPVSWSDDIARGLACGWQYRSQQRGGKPVLAEGKPIRSSSSFGVCGRVHVRLQALGLGIVFVAARF